jgi:hypothetical protein
LKNSRIGEIVVLLALFSLALSTSYAAKSPSSSPIAHTQSPPTAYASVFITTPSGTNNTDDLSQHDKTVTFWVNVSNSAPLNDFVITLSYNPNVFNQSSVNFAMNPLGSAAQVEIYCIDGLAQPGTPSTCPRTDETGDITLELYLLGQQTSSGSFISEATLFSVTFNIRGSGFGQLHILSANLVGLNPPGTSPVTYLIPLLPFGDGYFTNIACPSGSGVACLNPDVSIQFSPANPSPLTVVTFNVTATLKNSGAAVSTYTWNWGDGTGNQVQNGTSTPGILEEHQYGAKIGTGACVAAGNCTVTMSMLENDGVLWSTTFVVPITQITIKVLISDAHVNDQQNVVPGTVINVSATILNLGTIAEKASASITLEGRIPALASASYTLTQEGGSEVIQGTWDTAGYTPRVYALIVSVGNVSSAGKVYSATYPQGIIINGDLNATSSDTVATVYVQLITPQMRGALSLDLLQTTGLGIVVVLALGVGLARFLKKPSYETEPL